VSAITGYLVGAAVVLGTDELGETVEALLHHVRQYKRVSRRLFAAGVAERRLERSGDECRCG
jgi:hypothetical protein